MRSFIVAFTFALSLIAASADARAAGESGQASAAKAERCEHGVRKALCARCNPKLIPVFKAKGDWCNEHGVPESQCAKCNPKLAKDGVK